MEGTSEATPLEQLNIEEVVKDVLNTIEREREREIVARRFGLFDRKETLEQIGELLGITRERVRQLEKAVVAKLKAAAETDLPHIEAISKTLTTHVAELGNAAKISDLSARLTKENSKIDQARVAFLAKLTPTLAVIDEDDDHHQGAGLLEHHDDKSIKAHIADIVKIVKEHGQPVDASTIHAAHKKLTHEYHVAGLASLSKKLATLNGTWGLTKWPTVNPKNIRDKIYLILQDSGKPLHFSEISKAIKASEFKRKDVTTQAIHNELIKDKRFVLIGRGIYALKEWGYSRGTVADVITQVLKKSKEPMHRDEIIKQVLKQRQVKETTILLNLQGKPQFKRVAKATYALADDKK